MIPTSSELIDMLDGPAAVAKLLNIKAPSVVGWRKHGIPDDKLMRLAPICEQRGIATRQDLFPNDWQQIWPELAAQASTDSQPQ